MEMRNRGSVYKAFKAIQDFEDTLTVSGKKCESQLGVSTECLSVRQTQNLAFLEDLVPNRWSSVTVPRVGDLITKVWLHVKYKAQPTEVHAPDSLWSECELRFNDTVVDRLYSNDVIATRSLEYGVQTDATRSEKADMVCLPFCSAGTRSVRCIPTVAMNQTEISIRMRFTDKLDMTKLDKCQIVCEYAFLGKEERARLTSNQLQMTVTQHHQQKIRVKSQDARVSSRLTVSNIVKDMKWWFGTDAPLTTKLPAANLVLSAAKLTFGGQDRFEGDIIIYSKSIPEQYYGHAPVQDTSTTNPISFRPYNCYTFASRPLWYGFTGGANFAALGQVEFSLDFETQASTAGYIYVSTTTANVFRFQNGICSPVLSF